MEVSMIFFVKFDWECYNVCYVFNIMCIMYQSLFAGWQWHKQIGYMLAAQQAM